MDARGSLTRNERGSLPTATFMGGLVQGFQKPSVPADRMPGDWRLIRLGVQEINTRAVYGAAITEANFTMIFMFVHIGIARAANVSGFPQPAVWGATGHFLLIALLTFAAAAPSGAHFNPNITLATVMTGHTTVYRGMLYIIFQLFGAILGVLAMKTVLGWDGVEGADLFPCNYGDLPSSGCFMVEFMLFHTLLCVIGGIAFDPKQAEVFGPVKAPIFIASGVAMLILAASGEGYGPGLNWAQCVSTALVIGEFNGSEWYSFFGCFCASVFHSILFVSIPPSHQATGSFKSPLYEASLANVEMEDDAA